MPFRQTPKTHTPYAIIAFDKSGNERTDDPDGIKGLISDRLLSEVQQTGPSDIFVFSHGWQGDMVGAISQYDSWIDCKAALTADAAKMGTNFKPVYVGLHWPSAPWGDEELKGGGTSFDIGTVPASDALEAYLDRLDLKSSLHARELLGNWIFPVTALIVALCWINSSREPIFGCVAPRAASSASRISVGMLPTSAS